MGIHQDYGETVLTQVVGDRLSKWGQSVNVDYCAGGSTRIDGTIAGDIAVEIESRTGKQVRGAVLDLMMHPYPKKLLVLIPEHMSDVEETRVQCQQILDRYLDPDDFAVAVLNGTGRRWDLESDVPEVKRALTRLAFL